MSADTIILLHGLWMNGLESRLLARRLARNHHFKVRQFTYKTVRAGLRENVDSLSDFVRSVRGGTTHFVGHSLGGLLALVLIAEEPDCINGRAVCLGSPLNGSRAAASLAGLPGGHAILGKTLSQSVMTNSAQAWRDAVVNHDIGVIAGTMGVGAGRLVARLDKPHDGTVAVSETQLPGIADHLMMAVSHTGLLLSAQVAREIAYFLGHGVFRH